MIPLCCHYLNGRIKIHRPLVQENLPKYNILLSFSLWYTSTVPLLEKPTNYFQFSDAVLLPNDDGNSGFYIHVRKRLALWADKFQNGKKME